jgi:hypothetical protein
MNKPISRILRFLHFFCIGVIVLIAFVAVIGSVMGEVLKMAAFLGAFAIVFLGIIAYISGQFSLPLSSNSDQQIPRRPKIQTYAFVISLLITLSVFVFAWPLRLTFHFIRPTLDQIADRAEKGDLHTPHRVGFFVIEEKKVYPNGTTQLWFNKTFENNYGLVRTRSGWVGFNLYDDIYLGGGWHMVEED